MAMAADSTSVSSDYLSGKRKAMDKTTPMSVILEKLAQTKANIRAKVKLRLPQVLKWLAVNPMDVLCLQELKPTWCRKTATPTTPRACATPSTTPPKNAHISCRCWTWACTTPSACSSSRPRPSRGRTTGYWASRKTDACASTTSWSARRCARRSQLARSTVPHANGPGPNPATTRQWSPRWRIERQTGLSLGQGSVSRKRSPEIQLA